MMKRLFDDYLRTDTSAIAPGESAYQFLERSGRRRCYQVRQLLNLWSIPMLGDLEFISQLKSTDNKKHQAAVFELLVYTLLIKSGFSVIKHPEMATLTTPDFEVTKEAFKCFMECTLSGNSFENIEDENRKTTIENIIREMEYFPYFISIKFVTISKRSISKKALLNFIEGLKVKSEGFTNEQLFEMRHPFVNNGWVLEVFVSRKSSAKIKESLGILANTARSIDHVKPILSALNGKKATRYGIADTSYIIALNNSDIFFKEEEMNEVLFGYNCPLTINLSNSPRNGYLFGDGRAINTSVSAIILFKGFDVLALSGARVSIWHNPFAKHPVSRGTLPFGEYFYDVDGLYLKKQSYIKDFKLFDLLDMDETAYLKDPADLFVS